MNITPRKAEITALVTLLESDAYDSAEALAKEVFKTAYELLLDRDWWAYALRFKSGPPAIFWGPLSSENEARKFAERAGLVGVEHRAIPLSSVGQQLRRFTENEGPLVIPVCECGHHEGIHKHERAMGRCQRCRCPKLVLRKES